MMTNQIKTGLVALMLIAAIFAGAAPALAATTFHVATVKTVDTDYKAVDDVTISVFNTDGTLYNGQAYTHQSSSASIVLPNGVYKIESAKDGYTLVSAQYVDMSTGNQAVDMIMKYIGTTPGNTDNTGTGTGTGTSTGTTPSTDLYVGNLDFKDTVYPGNTVTFSLEVDAKDANTYTAKHVEAKLTVQNLNGGEDVTSTISIGSLDAGDSKDESFAIEIPATADADTYKVTVDLKWEDASGAQHIAKYPGTGNTVELEVAKLKHQVLITDMQEDRTSYKAGDTVQIAVSMVNTGSNDETVKITMASDVGVQTSSATVALKQGETSTQYLNFVVPENTKTGKYYTVVSVVYGSVSTIQRFILAIDGVTAVQPQSTVTVVQPAEQTSTPIPTTEIALGAIVLILAGIIAWFGKDAMSKGAAKPIIIKARGK